MRRIILVLVVLAPILVASPASARRPACQGAVQVPAGVNLAAIAAAHPAGTTFCLGAGTFVISSEVAAQGGDRFLGAGRDKTFIEGNGAVGILFNVTGGSATFRALDISGGHADSGCIPACGRAIRNSARLLNVRCHDNDLGCAGPGFVEMIDSECDHNGSFDLVDRSKRSASCIKTVRGGGVLVENSDIHDNFWNGVWCDFCDGSASFIVRDSRIVGNGQLGVHYEVSGQNGSFALIENNVIQGNGWRYASGQTPLNRPAGVVCSDCRDMEVVGNTFGDQELDGLGQRRAVFLFDTDRADVAYGYSGLPNVVIHDNALNGDVLVGCTVAEVTCSGNV